MHSWTVLTLGGALLGLLGGGTFGAGAVGDQPGGVDERATAAETSAPEHVSDARLRRVDGIELDAESIVLRRGSDDVTVVSMRDGDDVVDLLDRLLGTPARTKTAAGDGGRCLPAGTTYTWGGALRVAALAEPAALGNAVDVRLLRDEVRARTGKVVALEGPDGVRVGTDLRSRLDGAPDSDRASLGTEDAPAWQLVLQEGWSSDAQGAGTNGVSALTVGDQVVVIGSPMPVHASRSC